MLIKEVGNDQALLRFCKEFNGWCCDPLDSKADCCSDGVGFQWNNATLINYDFSQQQRDYTFDLAGAYTSVVASTWGANTPRTTISGSTPTGPATSMPMPTGNSSAVATPPTDACSSTPSVALEAGLAVGLGVPLLVLLAVLLWMLAKQKYNRHDSTNMSGKSIDSKLEEVQARPHSDVLQHEYVGGQHKWEKAQLHGEDRRAVAELN
ncbi:hypothetical protein PG993_012599 [Apiospora rasikravindrae]|uniref:Uncharacterized protein n=1 Tax=Apiospora rasikravindrae TaxID=990691 RepID=A0ABR1S3A6_9PEZI